MRKLLSLLLTLLICTSTIGQTNKLGQQMIQAGEICISGSRKATDCEVLQKTAEVLGRPVIGELATLLKERRLDLKDSLRREATIALLEEAENRFGKNSVEAVWCRFYATDAFTSLYPAEALRLAKENAESAKVLVGKNPNNRSIKTLDLLARLEVIYCINDQDIDNPLLWEEIFRIERECHELFGSDTTATEERRQVLFSLAMVKNNSSAYTDYVNYLAKSFFPNGFPRPGSSERNGLFNNLESYLTEVVEITRKLYGDEDIRTIGALTVLLEQKMYSESEPLGDVHSRLQDILRLSKRVCAPGEPLPIRIEVIMWDCDIKERQRLDETIMYRSRLLDFKRYFGQYSEAYFSYLLRVMDQRSMIDAMQARLLGDEMESVAKHLFPEDSPMQDMAKLWLLGIHQNGDTPEEFQDFLKQLKESYLRHHQSSWASVWFGKRLASVFSNDLYRNVDIPEIAEAYVNDLRQLCGEQSMLYAYELMQQAGMLSATQQAQQAEQALRQAMSIIQTSGEQDSRPHLLLAIRYFQDGRMDEAEAILRESLRLCPKDTIGCTYVRLYLAGVLQRGGSIPATPEVDELMQQALPLYLDTLEDISMAFTQGYEIVCTYYASKKQFQKAEQVLLRGLQLHTSFIRNYDENFLFFVRSLYSLYAYQYDDFDRAEQFIEGYVDDMLNSPSFTAHPILLQLLFMHLDMLKAKMPTDIVRRSSLLNDIYRETNIISLAAGFTSVEDAAAVQLWLPVLREMGELFSFWPVWEQSLEEGRMAIATASDPQIKAEYQEMLDAGMQNYQSVSEQLHEQAKVVIDEVKSSIEELYPDDYLNRPEYFIISSVLANYYYYIEHDAKQCQQIIIPFTQSTKLQNQADALCYLADMANEEGNYLESAQWREKYLQKLKESDVELGMFGLATQQNNLFWSYFLARDFQKALTPAWEFRRLRRQVSAKNFDLMTQLERESFLNNGATGGHDLMCLLPHYPEELAAESYDYMLELKGLLLRTSERTRRAIRNSGDAELVAALDSLDNLNAQFKQTELNTGLKGNFSVTPEAMQLRTAIERLERDINRRSASLVDQTDTIPCWRDVQQALHPGEAAIEYVLTDSLTAALVLLSDESTPHFVLLTKTQPLLDALTAMETMGSKSRAEELYLSDALNLYQRLWEPLLPYLKNVRIIYFSPTAYLNSLAFAAFRTPDGRPLMDLYELHQVSSTADVLRHSRSSALPSDALLVGGVFYSPEQEQLAKQSSQRKQEDDKNQERGAIMDEDEEFGFLEFTMPEVQDVERIMESVHIDVKVLSGFTSTEPSLQSINGHSPGILHLSTHGFFVATEEAVSKNKFLARFPGMRFSSMQRAGLALTDANAAWQGEFLPEEADGILTANEVALLDLSKTRLAVLSACQTANGLYSMDGVYGMHRGFKQAGVKSVLATLWNVNDQSTAEMMNLFYSKWLGGETMQQAFHEAKQKLREHYPSPFYWAAFILLDALD